MEKRKSKPRPKELEGLTKEEIQELALEGVKKRNLPRKIEEYLSKAEEIAKSNLAKGDFEEYWFGRGFTTFDYGYVGSANFGDFVYDTGKEASIEVVGSIAVEMGVHTEYENKYGYVYRRSKDRTLSYKGKIMISDGEISLCPVLFTSEEFTKSFNKFLSLLKNSKRREYKTIRVCKKLTL